MWFLLGSVCGTHPTFSLARNARSGAPACLRPPTLIHKHIPSIACKVWEAFHTSITNQIIVRWYILRCSYRSTHCRLLWQKIRIDGYVNQVHVSFGSIETCMLTSTVTMLVFSLGVILQTIATAIPMFVAGFVTE